MIDFRMAGTSLNDVEAMADRGERIAAYRAMLAAEPAHSLAWFNLAVDELDDGAVVGARRALLRALTIDESLRAKLLPRLVELVSVGGVDLTTELAVSPTMLLYSGRADDGSTALVRALRDRPPAAALAAYGAHARLEGSHPDLIRALRVSAPSGGERFQILEYTHGQPIGALLRGAGPHQGFAIAKVPRVDVRVASALAIEILDVVHRNRAELVLEPNPDLWLRTRGGVLSLGPPGLSPSVEWMTPEERDGSAVDPERGLAYRAALLLWTAITGSPPPTLQLSGVRTIDAAALPEPLRMLAPTLQAAVDRDPTARLTLGALLERVRGLLQGPITVDGDAPPTIAGYRLLKPLGEGGFGAVYEAVRLKDNTRVAVKILHRHLASSGEARMRFFNEAEIASRVQHPGVVRSYDHGSADGTDYIAMELVDGPSLERHLANVGALSAAETIAIGQQTAAAVGAVHRTAGGVVHRDLKPGNLLLSSEALQQPTGPDAPTIAGAQWTVKVTDFGIAKLLGEPTERGLPFTQTGQWNGTPPYMAPEQWRQEAVDPRTDVYALGCLLYECLTGHPPFSGTRPYELLEAHLHQAPPPLPQTVPPRLAAAVMRMLAKRPEDRFADMAAVEAALAPEALAPPPPSPPPPPPTTTPDQTVVLPPASGRRRGLWLGLGAVAVAGAAVGVGLAVKSCDGGGRATSIDASIAMPDPVAIPIDAAVAAPIVAPIDAGPTDIPPPVGDPRCADRLFLEWPPAVCVGRDEGVWEWTAVDGCVRRVMTIPELEIELRNLQRLTRSGFARLPPQLTIEVTGPTRMGVIIRDAVGQEVGNVLVSYAGSGPRDGGLRNAVKINTRVDRSAPVFMSRAGFWCSAENRVLARVRPRLVP